MTFSPIEIITVAGLGFTIGLIVGSLFLKGG